MINWKLVIPLPQRLGAIYIWDTLYLKDVDRDYTRPSASEYYKYSGTCLRWSLCKAATSLKQPASLAPDSTKALESISVEQPPLYNGQLELAHRWLVILARFHCIIKSILRLMT